MSTHHDKDVDILEIGSVGIGNHMPIHVERLSITHQMKAMKPHSDALKFMFRHHNINGGPSKTMKKAIIKMHDICNKMIEMMEVEVEGKDKSHDDMMESVEEEDNTDVDADKCDNEEAKLNISNGEDDEDDDEEEEDENGTCNGSKEHSNGDDSYSNYGTFGFEY